MARSTDIKGCRMSFLFVVVVICVIIIPELESKHLFRAGKKVKNNDGNSHSSVVPRKKDKPKLEYDENTSAKSKSSKSLKKNEKYLDGNDGSTTLENNNNKHAKKNAKRRTTKQKSDKNLDRHLDKSAEEETAESQKNDSFNVEYSDESPESRIANQPQPDSDYSEYSVDSDDKHKQKRGKSGPYTSKLEQSYNSHPEESTERTKISESSKSQSERSREHSQTGKSKFNSKSVSSKNRTDGSQKHPSKDRSKGSAKRSKNNSSSQSDERKSKSLKSENNGGSSRSSKRSVSSNERKDSSQQSTSKHHGHGSGKRLEDGLSVRSDKNKSKSLKSETLGDHLRSNRAHGKDKQSKSSETTKSEKVSPDTGINENQDADFTVENTVTDKQLISASSTSVSGPVYTTTSFSKFTTSETNNITTSKTPVSNSDSTTKSSVHATELNPDSEPGNEQETSHVLDTEPGIIIKPPYPGRRKCKERTPPCCVRGQLEINLGTINYKARANGVLDGVTTEVSDKPQKRYIRCSNSAKIKVTFESMGNNGCFGCTNGPFCGRRLLQLDLELSRNRRRNTLFHISDSSHKSDGATVHAEFPDVTIYPRHSAENGTSQIRIKGALNARTNKITLFIGNQFIRLINDNRLDENFCDNNLFHINGQIEPENGGMSPNEITIGINRAISSQEDEANFGVCSATLKWACPWQES